MTTWDEDKPRRPKQRCGFLLSDCQFRDRLGYHVLYGILPAYAEVAYASLNPWMVPYRDYDLLVVGIGNSLFPTDARNAMLGSLTERVPRSIGIFGTHHRSLFR